MPLTARFPYFLLFTVVLYAVILTIYNHFPAETAFRFNSDEGVYLRQAMIVKEKGLAGFRDLCDIYLKNENQEQLFPNPLRVGHILLATLFYLFSPHATSLAFLSLCFFAALCCLVFLFLKNRLPLPIATLAACLVCISPLLGSLSSRALSDTDSCFFQILTLFMFLRYLEQPGAQRLAVFIISFSASILVKETGVIFIPFYLAYMIYYRGHGKKGILPGHIVAGSILPILTSAVVILLCLGSLDTVFSIGNIIAGNNMDKATVIPYVRDYNSGPWYQYLVDYMLLSPLLTILFLLFAGHYILQKPKTILASALLLYVVYFLLSYEFLPKNVHYALSLDIPLRIGATLYLVQLFSSMPLRTVQRKIAFSAVILLLAGYDINNYFKFFVDGAIYDPVIYDPLRVERMIPL